MLKKERGERREKTMPEERRGGPGFGNDEESGKTENGRSARSECENGKE